MEWQLVVSGIRARTDIDIRSARGLDDVRNAASAGGWFPDLVIVLQIWPGQFSGRDVGLLLSLAPLARVVCVYGAWCDSEGRTHDHWPLAVRSRTTCAVERIAAELAALCGTGVSLPLTAARSEIFAADFGAIKGDPSRPVSVMVISNDRHWRRMMRDGLARMGVCVRDPGSAETPSGIVWDADPWNRIRVEALRALRREFRNARIVACAGFPRPDLDLEIQAAGAGSVWFKLAPLATLRRRFETEPACER